MRGVLELLMFLGAGGLALLHWHTVRAYKALRQEFEGCVQANHEISSFVMVAAEEARNERYEIVQEMLGSLHNHGAVLGWVARGAEEDSEVQFAARSDLGTVCALQTKYLVEKAIRPIQETEMFLAKVARLTLLEAACAEHQGASECPRQP